MRWHEVREKYPDQWLIVEALEAHTEAGKRILDRLAVVEMCPDGETALERYRALHQQYPERELYFVHTARETLDIRERQWLGIRRAHAAISAPKMPSQRHSTPSENAQAGSRAGSTESPTSSWHG